MTPKIIQSNRCQSCNCEHPLIALNSQLLISNHAGASNIHMGLIVRPHKVKMTLQTHTIESNRVVLGWVGHIVRGQ